MNDDLSQGVAKDVAANTVEHQVMDILNPRLHHHDLLQSYVRTRVETGSDLKQDVEELEEAHSSKSNANGSDNRKDNFRYDGRKKKNNDKTERSDTAIASVESEMRIQKSRKT